ncbi:MAG: YceI family protein [Chloroflexota bacterium]
MPGTVSWRYAAVVLLGTSALLVAVAAVTWLVTNLAPSAAAAPGIPPVPQAVRAEGTRVDLIAESGEARYRALEVLSGRGSNEAVGKTADITGRFVFDADGNVIPDQSQVTVDLRRLTSDNAMRDRYIQRMTLQTEQFPSAIFVLIAAQGLPLPLPTSGSATFDLIGDLTLHGVTRPATWQTTVTFDNNEVVGSASTTVLLTEFGMEPPRAGPVLSIEDAVRLELDVRGAIAPSIPDLLTDPT